MRAGSCRLLSSRAWTPSVLESESWPTDPTTGLLLTNFTDLHKFLNTDARHPKRHGVSNDGYLEDTIARGSREVSKISAYRILGRTSVAMSLNFANFVDSIISGCRINRL